MTRYKLTAKPREIKGRKVKTLRAEGVIPANVYGKKLKSFEVSVLVAEFKKVFDEAGETGLLDLAVGKKAYTVLISNVQVHPVTDEILHVDFRNVDLKEKVTSNIPVELTGESPAEAQGIGTVGLQVSEITVEALPADLPEKFEVDISEMSEVDQTFVVADLKYEKSKVEIKNEADQVVAVVQGVQEEKEEVLSETPGEEEVVEGEEGEDKTEDKKEEEATKES